jgi:multidrug transporter EmrE-like cation transporter
MSGWLIAVTGVIYAYVCLEQATKGNLRMGIAYAGYAFSNIGLFLLASK